MKTNGYQSMQATPLESPRRPRILFIDAYDSFANNIVALVQESLNADVEIIRIDDPRYSNTGDLGLSHLAFLNFLSNFDAIIAGPGPGTVNNDKDVGLIKKLWQLDDADVLPILGICLGFQSLAANFGSKIERLRVPRHGIVSNILHSNRSIFAGLGEVHATQYHSLQVNIYHPIQTSLEAVWNLWKSTDECPQLEPLAWDFDDESNGAVLMATKHTMKPFWGVQYHPESICTSDEGKKIIQNWWKEAKSWSSSHPRTRTTTTSHSYLQHITNNPGQPKEKLFKAAKHLSAACSPEDFAQIIAYGHSPNHPRLRKLSRLPPECLNVNTTRVGRLCVTDLCELLKIQTNEAIVLQSGLINGLPVANGTGRYSIIGLFVPGETLRIHYYAPQRKLQLRNDPNEILIEIMVQDVWAYLKDIMQHLKLPDGPLRDCFTPFWGGLMGYVTYEAGLQTINVAPSPPACGVVAQPDICFAYITRSIVIDHQLGDVYVQSIRGHDMEWVSHTISGIQEARDLKNPPSALGGVDFASPQHSLPHKASYVEKIRRCKESIGAGDSYELCLTDQTKITVPKIPSTTPFAWHLYKTLIEKNPAPFTAYIRMGQVGQGVNILSSSPERFMSWNRYACCECRPIKGTVKKAPGVTLADAEAILSSSKEQAENLMIVDLTRHQLHGVYGAGNVEVTKLMQVEEFETVYQLVSVVEGRPTDAEGCAAPEEDRSNGNADYVPVEYRPQPTGIEALAASLPPGSMTGAPKKRSCELLKDIENNEPRGIYAGIIGYLDVGGGGDFSVVIRTAVKWDGVADDPDEEWRIGAGGAITAQSTEDGEYEEMIAKLDSIRQIFVAPPASGRTIL